MAVGVGSTVDGNRQVRSAAEVGSTVDENRKVHSELLAVLYQKSLIDKRNLLYEIAPALSR